MATTVTQSELDTLNEENKVSTQAADVEQTYTGKFIGTLIGNATTAKELEAPYNFTLTGDATGTTKVNAKDTNLKVTVNHATEADTADFAGKTNLAARATLADMANTAEFAYRAGRLSNLIITLAGAITGTGQLTNSDQMKLTVSKLDASYLFVFSAKPDNPDQGKIYFDIDGRHLWIFDTATSKWKDGYSQLNYYINRSESRLGVLEPKMTTAQTDINNLKTLTNSHTSKLENHENRITVNENELSKHNERINTNLETINELKEKVATCETTNASQTQSLIDHEKRLGSIETTSDIGAFSQRMTAVEDKNEAQDLQLASLPNNYVTLNTSQEIKSIKTINKGNGDALYIKNTAVDLNVVPNDTKSTNIVVKDAKNKVWGYLQWQKTKDDLSGAWLVIKGSEDSNIGTSFSLVYDKKHSLAYALAPTTPENAISREVVTASFVKNKVDAINKSIATTDDKVTAVQSNYVTTNTSQQITGTKTFTSALNGVAFEFNQVPTTYKNGGWIDFHYAGDTGDYTTRIIEDAKGQLTIVAPNGVLVPSVPANENSNKIPHTKWVNTAIANATANMATVDTLQDITTIKSHLNDLYLVSERIDINSTVKETVGRALVFQDKNREQLAYVQCAQNTNGDTILNFAVKSKANSSADVKSNSLRLAINKSGGAVAYSPTPTTSVTGNQVITAEWAIAQGSVVQTNLTSYVRWSNGLQMVWRGGSLPNSQQLTFPVPFKDANYIIIGAGLLIDGITQTIIDAKTTTYFQISSASRLCNPYGCLCIGKWK